MSDCFEEWANRSGSTAVGGRFTLGDHDPHMALRAQIARPCDAAAKTTLDRRARWTSVRDGH
jgi:hypothetical protein